MQSFGLVIAMSAIFLGVIAFGQEGGRARQPDAAKQPSLPLSEVILYSSGVGYFQRDGKVEGQTEVNLRFKVDNINDLLKSMVVQDFDGGQVSTVTYESRDPITKTLKSFGIDLTSNPSLGQLLGQVRGERVEIEAPVSSQQPIVGTIVGVETKEEPAGENKTVEVEYLNLLTDAGLQYVPLQRVQRIKLLNEQLNSELRQALEVLALGHDTQKKSVAIRFDGQGERQVSVSYIMETPVWKTSYRLVLDDKEQPFLQGWAIVENTTDDDWSDVRLSLISGRPISFIMDMYQPLYVARPVVVPELYASLRPQTYGEAMDRLSEKEAAVPLAAARAGAMPAPAAAPAPSRERSLGRFAGESLAVDRAAASKDLSQGVVSAAESLQSGELFQYAIKKPVSLARQKSAMLPIVSDNVEGEKVSIYNQSVHAKFPLNGFRLKNTTQLNLMQGPITVFDAGTYAGDARIEDVAPGQERLISYAMDLKTEVEPLVNLEDPELVSVQLRKGTLIATRKAFEDKTYNVRNRDQKKKVVLVEHPFRNDWQLLEPTEPTERTRDVYRFAVAVEPDKSARLRVREERQILEQVQITNLGPDVIAYYQKAKKVSQKVKEALQRVVALRDRVSQTAAERGRREQRVAEIAQEQTRIRENMNQLAQNSELYNRYVKKLDQQETEIENLRKEIETLRATEAKQLQELNEYLLSLEID